MRNPSTVEPAASPTPMRLDTHFDAIRERFGQSCPANALGRRAMVVRHAMERELVPCRIEHRVRARRIAIARLPDGAHDRDPPAMDADRYRGAGNGTERQHAAARAFVIEHLVVHVPDDKFKDKVVKDMREYVCTAEEVAGEPVTYEQFRDDARKMGILPGWLR